MRIKLQSEDGSKHTQRSYREVWGGEGLLVCVLLDLDGEVGGVELGQDQPQHQHRVHYQTPLLRRVRSELEGPIVNQM